MACVGGQEPTFSSCFSASTIWVLRVELWSSVLVAIALSTVHLVGPWVPLLAPPFPLLPHKLISDHSLGYRAHSWELCHQAPFLSSFQLILANTSVLMCQGNTPFTASKQSPLSISISLPVVRLMNGNWFFKQKLPLLCFLSAISRMNWVCLPDNSYHCFSHLCCSRFYYIHVPFSPTRISGTVSQVSVVPNIDHDIFCKVPN